MDKLWSSFEERSTDKDLEVEIVSELFFSTKQNIGQIREFFDTWSIDDLKITAQEIYYSPTEENEAEEINHFGDDCYFARHPYREGVILQSIGDQMWNLCSRKKKFF